ncbi:MAG TPA: helix-turn-helix transcriptional regulator [Streptosporangiaceae bacterium]|nr:helix-turn-helix transcriptional regulator [Streptosporangiaceae bacterium]
MTAEPISPAARAFGERVRTRRHELGESQEQLADASGLHWTFVGQVERGRRNVSLHNILKLAAGLQVDPGDLVRGLQRTRGLTIRDAGVVVGLGMPISIG